MMKPVSCILLVDDDDDTNMVVTHFIKKEHLADEVVVAIDGEEALQYIKSNPPPSLIFLDINMPRMNGWEFLEEYRKLPREIQDSSIIVMITVSLNPDDRERAKKHKLEFINKPLTADLLKKVIESYKN